MASKASKNLNNFKPKVSPAPELASLPPPVRSLQRVRTKRGTIRPILNQEPIKSGARVDPMHPAATLSNKSFRAPYAGHEYFNTKAYPNAMLKRLGVIIEPNGRLKPRPPPEREFPIFKHKRIKLARTYVMPIKSTHKRHLSTLYHTHWYYVFYPQIPIYHAPWPSLIKAVRESLLAILKQGREMDVRWNLEIADREAKAMARLSRREMRRARMWRRQDQEAVSHGQLSEDVGVRWKLKGTGAKKRPVGEKKPGAEKGVKVLRAPSRSAFQRGNTASPLAALSVPKKAPVVPKLENSARAAAPPRLTTPTKLQAEATRLGAEPRTTRKSHTTRNPLLPAAAPKLSEGKSKLSGEHRGPKFMIPPTKSLIDSLRRKPLSKSTPDSSPGSKPSNRDKSSSTGGNNTSSTFKRET
ncbi:unnamed protein product [Rhizoctonia solani]|uniref:Uncharacterized protein n=1 Tax=Rhizoctonia solani TaxID=456999 RepID=A0A8H3BBB6_9AGAM|nr:unnamed protein product [Rhizoctonia solani]